MKQAEKQPTRHEPRPKAPPRPETRDGLIIDPRDFPPPGVDHQDAVPPG